MANSASRIFGGDNILDLLGSSHRHRRFGDDDRETGKGPRYLLGCRKNKGEVGRILSRSARRSDCDEHDVSGSQRPLQVRL